MRKKGCSETPSSSTSKRNFPCQHFPEHHEVAHQAVDGVGECCRSVLLDEEMTNPGKTVACQWHCPEERPLAGDQGHQGDGQHQCGAAKMEAAVGAVTVLSQVERVKLCKRGVLFIRFHFEPCSDELHFEKEPGRVNLVDLAWF